MQYSDTAIPKDGDHVHFARPDGTTYTVEFSWDTCIWQVEGPARFNRVHAFSTITDARKTAKLLQKALN